MESLFRNCVSEFDLNFLDQTTNGKEASQSLQIQCPVSRKHGIARMKDRLKGISQVVHKAKHTNQLLLENQQELLETKQELEETRNLLFEKNEEYRVICDERSVYFSQATEYSNDIQKLKEQLKQFKENEYELKLKDKIIQGYIDQVTGLQTEMTNLMRDKKHSERETSLAVLQANKDRGIIEKKLVKLLSSYVCPTIKKRDKWLQSLIKKYLPNKKQINNYDLSQQTKTSVEIFENIPVSPQHKEEQCLKILKSSDETVVIDHPKQNENVLDDIGSPIHNSMQHRNISIEFECVESVDTGRGSSLAFSDGEKSFHSPDYYMNDSPLCTVSSLCNKCNVVKSDASTSPIPLESDIANNFASNLFLSRSDACTSPIQLKRLHVATETNDIVNFYQKQTPSKELNTNSISKIQNDVKIIHHLNSNLTSTSIRIDESSEETDSEETRLNHIKISNKEPIVPDNLKDNLEFNNYEVANNVYSITGSESLIVNSPVDFDDNVRPSTPTKLSNKVISDSGKALNEISRTSSPDDGFTMISPIDFDEGSTNSNNITSKELLTASSEIKNRIPDTKPNINQKLLREKECLKLNGSDNFGSDFGTDREIQTILDKMRLQHDLITPIPRTPPQITMKSPNLPIENLKEIVESNIQGVKPITDAICEDLNLIRLKLREAFSPLVGHMPLYVQQIMLLLSDSKPNEKLLRNLILNCNSSKNTHTADEIEQEILSHDTHIESRNKTKLQAANLNVASTSTTKIKNIKKVNENNGSVSNEDAKMHLESEDLKQTMNVKSSNNEKEEICNTCKVLPYTENSRIAVIPEVEKSSLVDCHIEQAANDSHTNNIYNGDILYKNIQNSNMNEDMNIDYNTNQNSVESLDNESVLGTRNNIVYESEGNASDDDADMQQVSGSGDVEQIPKNINSNNENTKIYQNESLNNTSSSKTSKTKKLTKLEKMRLKMAPKCKIRNEVKQSVKKLRFKPTPIIIPHSIPKKKVTESDTAASLNDKSVYENAVKVIAASKPSVNKEARVVVEDCVLTIHKKSPRNARNESNNVENNSNKPQSTTGASNKMYNHKRKLVFDLENASNVPTKLSEDTKKSVVANEMRKRKRTTTFSDDDVNDDAINLKQLQHKLNGIDDAESEVIACQRSSSFSFNKTALESFSIKRTNEVVLKGSNESISNTEVKRKRASISGCLSPNKKPNSNNHIIEVMATDNRTSHQKNSGCEAIITKRLSTSTRQRTSIETDHAVLRSIVTENRENIHKSPIPKSNLAILESSSRASTSSQRILRSSNMKQSKENGLERTPCTNTSYKMLHSKTDQIHLELPESVSHDRMVNYADLNLFSMEDNCRQEQMEKTQKDDSIGYRNNLLCRTIEKHGVYRIKFCTKKVPDSKVNGICSKLEKSISQIIELPHDQCLGAMKKLVTEIRSWDVKLFLVGLIKYLKSPQRKIELFKKLSCPPAPPMTSKEQVLLYVIDELQNCYEYRNIVKKILINIEYILFALNKTPEDIDVIESMSHFYALLCRSYHSISKLRLFIIDAMYCLQYKSIILIKQCLDVWMFALPLGHMGLAKTPLVACLVYLLHFYKCEDKFNRIQDMRTILRRKYNYDLTDWNENKILELFKNAIAEIKDIPIEKKMLRLALIILAKRNGPTWCQNNIVKKMLQPMIKDKCTSEVAKEFCVSLLGPLLKPYPNNMKVHCEMATDYLLDMLGEKNSPKMQEAIITSLLCMNKQNNRVIQFLINWNPNIVSPEFESVFRDYVRSKPLKKWKTILSSLT